MGQNPVETSEIRRSALCQQATFSCTHKWDLAYHLAGAGHEPSFARNDKDIWVMEWSALHRARLDGVELPYVEHGKGEPVVLVHGSNADHRIWDRHREIISSHYRVIAMSQRYFGIDPWPDNGEKFCISVHANDLGAFVQGLRVGPVTIIGWSYGGAVSLAMATQNRELVKRMFLYEPSLTTFVTVPEDAKAVLEDILAMMHAAKKLADSRDLAGAVRLLMDDVNAEIGAFDRLAPEVKAMMTENARMLPLLFAGPPPPSITATELRGLKIPITIALGQDSRACYRIAAHATQALLPFARLTIVENAKHLWPIQETHAFSRLVLNFLEHDRPMQPIDRL